MATITGTVGTAGSSASTQFASPVSLGVSCAAGTYPNGTIEFPNIKSGGHAYWKNTHSGTRSATLYLCDSAGNNKVKIFDISLAGKDTSASLKSATISGASALAGKALYLVMTGDTTYIRLYNQTSVTITIANVTYSLAKAASPSGGGSVTLGASTGASGTKIKVTAKANTGYSFSSWTKSAGTLSSTSANPTTFTMPASNATVTANFTHNTYSVTKALNPSAGGGATFSASSGHYGDKIQVKASANIGYTFSSWSKSSGSLSNTTASTSTFTLPAGNSTVTANFTHNTYSVSKAVSPSGGGSVTLGAASGYYNDKIQIKATANTGYTFSGWTKSGGSLSSTTAATSTFTLPAANSTVTASFTHNTYSLSKAVSPSGGGSVTLGAASGYYNDKIQIKAAATSGYQFTGWTSSGGTIDDANAATTTFTMPASNATVTAAFSKIDYSISTFVDPAGSGTLGCDKTTAQVRDIVTLTPTPASGYAFDSYTTSPAVAISNNTFAMPASNVSITANFYLAASASTCTLDKASYEGGETAVLTIDSISPSYSHKYRLRFNDYMDTGIIDVAAGVSSVNIYIPVAWSKYGLAITGGVLSLGTYDNGSKVGSTFEIPGITYTATDNTIPKLYVWRCDENGNKAAGGEYGKYSIVVPTGASGHTLTCGQVSATTFATSGDILPDNKLVLAANQYHDVVLTLAFGSEIFEVQGEIPKVVYSNQLFPSAFEESGALVGFESDTMLPIEAKIDLKPIQNLNGQPGTYLGGAGVNILPVNEISNPSYTGIEITRNADESITITGTPASSTWYVALYGQNSVDPALLSPILGGMQPGDKYGLRIEGAIPGITLVSALYGEDGQILKLNETTSNGTFTIPDDIVHQYIGVRLKLADFESTPINVTLKTQVSKGNSNPAWAPYTNICSISGHTSTTIMRYGENLLEGKFTTTRTGGVSYTANADGSVSTEGTATSNTALRSDVINVSEGETYKLCGCPSGGATDKYRLDVRDSAGALINGLQYDAGNGAMIVIPSGVEQIKIGIRVNNGCNVSGLLFKPVLTKVVNWNQLAEGYRKNKCTITENGRSARMVADADQGYFGSGINVNDHKVIPQTNHAYLIFYTLSDIDIPNLSKIHISNGHKAGTVTSGINNYVGEGDYAGMFYGKDTPADMYFNADLISGMTTVGGEEFTISNMQLFDLTQIFGNEIADAVYDMESANAGDGVTWFRERFPNNYYAYTTGSPQSLEAVSNPAYANSSSITFTPAVYGGEVDWPHRKLIISKAFTTWEGEEEETYIMDYDDQYGWRRFRRLYSNADGTSGRKLVLCNRGTFSLTAHTVGTCFLNLSYIYFYPPTDITSIEDFKTWLQSNNLQFVYPLATPVMSSLRGLPDVIPLDGKNTVWATNSDSIHVKYRSDL